jgi:hypothetical protein
MGISKPKQKRSHDTGYMPGILFTCFLLILQVMCFYLCCVRSTGLADIMKRLLIKYDNLFHTSFPYSMGWHGKMA